MYVHPDLPNDGRSVDCIALSSAGMGHTHSGCYTVAGAIRLGDSLGGSDAICDQADTAEIRHPLAQASPSLLSRSESRNNLRRAGWPFSSQTTHSTPIADRARVAGARSLESKSRGIRCLRLVCRPQWAMLNSIMSTSRTGSVSDIPSSRSRVFIS